MGCRTARTSHLLQTPKGLGHTFKVFRTDMNEAMTWGIDIGDQKEGDCDHERKDKSQPHRSARMIAQQHCAEKSDSCH